MPSKINDRVETKPMCLSPLSGFVWPITILFLVAITGCNQDGEEAKGTKAAAKPANQIVAVSYPLQYLTQRLIGPDVPVSFPVPADRDPKLWQPNTEAIREMQSADLIVVNGPGANYADWLIRVSLPESKVCHSVSQLAIADFIQVKDYQIVHTHGPEGEHSHPLMVPYTWLDPRIAKKQAIKIAEALKRAYPEQADQVESNLSALNQDLDLLTSELVKVGVDRELTVITANPNLKFFTRAAGIADHHMLWFEEPNDQGWENTLKQKVEETGAAVLLTAGEPSQRMLAVFDSLNLSVAVLDTLDHRPKEGDYLAAVRKNIERLQRALAN